MHSLPPHLVDGLFSNAVRLDPETGCWLWRGHLNPGGYGRWGQYLAHRLVYVLFKGEPPDGLELDHTCRRPACVNPDHLEPVTHEENMRRRPWQTAGGVFKPADKKRLWLRVKIDGKWKNKPTPFYPGEEEKALAMLRTLGSTGAP